MQDSLHLTNRLDALAKAAEADLAAAAGDLSLCVIGKSGQSFPAVKYHEGRASAISMVRRSLTNGSPVETAVESVRTRFGDMSRLAQDNDEWEAYRQGGLDMLIRLEET